MKRQELSWSDVRILANKVAVEVLHPNNEKPNSLYGIPRGGIHAVQLVAASPLLRDHNIQLVENPEQASHFIDDIVDSGATRKRWREKYPEVPFHALVEKLPHEKDVWVEFPWERMVLKEDGPQDNIRRLLQYIGEDPDREGLKETPDRIIRSYEELFYGYHKNPADYIKVFEESSCDEMVVVKGIEIFSLCEHHMLPFFGHAHIGYVPNGRVIGVSKLARVVEVFARRLQVQERLTTQITAALDEHLTPKGSACVIEASHLCMQMRGVGKQHSRMSTSSLTGVFREKPEARAEFLNLVRS